MINLEQYYIFSFLFPVLYAETHYRFKYFFSWLKKSEPEIITDIPSRIQKGIQLPILLIIKDADKYNVEIIEILVCENNKELFSEKINILVNQSYFDRIFYVDTTIFEIRKHDIDIRIKYKIKSNIKTCINDNHRGTKHSPFPLYISETLLPKFNNCYYGETHSHTNYTSDQLEFGASINSTSVLAESLGLSFFCATDHSYDLDDEENNYLKNDPNLPKWKNFKNEVKHENDSNPNFKIIAGEEASLHNHKNKNIHCLIYNSEKFYPGNGDSGEKWIQPFSELTIKNVLNDVDDNTLVFAAHPVEPVPFLQKLLIRRDNWHEEDCRNPRLNGLQFANGGPKKYFDAGKKLWVKLLLEGHKLTGLAGNDAHGNFARYRQVSFPFIKMEENYFHLFGVWRTGVYLESSEIDKNSILQSIKNGNCFLTNGPALQFQAIDNDKTYPMGSSGEQLIRLLIESKSNEEFGMLNNISIFQGTIGEDSEKEIIKENIIDKSIDYNFELNINKQAGNCYFRCEVETDLGKIALSNPIWHK